MTLGMSHTLLKRLSFHLLVKSTNVLKKQDILTHETMQYVFFSCEMKIVIKVITGNKKW